ncbi:conserved hypothetical protein [Agrobacterium tumefaciens str. Kerr 14]|uniref:Uncharacterized protein n=1 Tax=Agrobacterium tumefaciens str. Kerr 14 TaxID=1183424 RepID=A0A1S7NVD0_AGRTU|nr:conserved hypothetical protein [Agrobacterium tumefaciens str. Kerr 14]CUX15102.1 conserved hypothetical protein [Agrobacterium tumefaciens str. CFBP 5621]
MRSPAALHIKYTGNIEGCVVRMPDLHKKELFRAQKSTISLSADAHGGFSSQFHRISCSPLEVFDLHT